MKKLFLIVVTFFAANFSQAQWEPDVRLTNDAGTSWTSYNNAWCVAASGDTVHVVWEDDRDGHFEVYYKRSTDGGISWGTDIRLTNSLNHSQKPSIAVSGSVVHVFWFYHQWIGNFEIYYKRSTDGGQTWGPDTQLTNANGNSWEISASTSGSTVHVVWEDSRDSLFLNTEIYYKRSTDGGLTWDAEVQLSNDPDYSGFPSIAASGSFVHVVWDDERDANGEIYYIRSIDGGLNWGDETRLTNDSDDSWMPCITVSGSTVHVVWSDWRDGLTGEIYYKQSTDEGISWNEDSRLTISFGESLFPSITANNSFVHIVWNDYRFMTDEIFYQHSEDGGIAWDPVDTRLTNSSDYSTCPSIATAGSAVHVVWMDFRDGNDEIYYQRNPTGGIPVGIGNEPANITGQEISIYPNPASSRIHVQFNDYLTTESLFTIRNIFGKTLMNQSIRRGEEVIDVSMLPNGIYFATSKIGNKPVYTTKLIITKD